ncbi:ANTH domain [Nakaseomyces glabratus]
MALNKLVKGATKIKMAPPKDKYVGPILQDTSTSRHSMQEAVQLLGQRIAGSNEWTIVFKSLIMLHLMIQYSEQSEARGFDDDDDYYGGNRRKGDGSPILDYMSRNLDFFNSTRKILSSSKWSRDDIKVIERYNQYLKIRCKEYDLCNGTDYVKVGFNIAMKYRRERSQQNLGNKNISISTELDHVESLENTITALIKNRFSQIDLQNDLILYTFKMLVTDLLPLYNSLNGGVIALLESFFELDRAEAKRTLELYKSFVDLTDHVVNYLKIGKSVGLKIPVIKHITTKLISSLEDHIRNEERGGVKLNSQRKVSSNTTAYGDESSRNANQPGTLQRSETTSSMAQQKLEQIREQKKILEQQLQNQQVLITPTVPQEPYVNNPFTPSAADTFSFEPTGSNPFAPQMTSPQMMMQQQQPQAQPQQPMQTSPMPMVQQGTSMYVGNQMTGFTGGNVNGIQQQSPQQPLAQQPLRTGSNNPFALENMAQYETVDNPFGTAHMPTIQEVDMQQMQMQQPVTYAMIPVQITNPFQQQQQQM